MKKSNRTKTKRKAKNNLKMYIYKDLLNFDSNFYQKINVFSFSKIYKIVKN